MVSKIQVVTNEPIVLPAPQKGVSEGGIMALARLPGFNGNPHAAVGRGIIRPGGQSCLFTGTLCELTLCINEVRLHPLYPTAGGQYRPLTDRSEVVWGYEDPTPLHPDHNFVEPGFWGCLLTEAFHSHERMGWIDCNTVYYGLTTRRIETYVRPAQILRAGLWHYFDELNLVKEFQSSAAATPGYVTLTFEVGAKRRSADKRLSRICMAQINDRGEPQSARPLFDPEDPQTPEWMREHASPAGNPISLGDALLTIFNGRNNNCWQIGWCLHEATGKILRWGEPFISPPPGVEPGPDGQEIAFGSDVTVVSRDDSAIRLEVLYHAQDRYPCIAMVDVHLG